MASETVFKSCLLGRDKWGKQCNVHNDRRGIVRES